jgi:hypothetical protein
MLSLPTRISCTKEAVGEVELDDNVLVIRRIHVILKLKAEESHRETASRVHGFFADRCPVYRTLKTANRDDYRAGFREVGTTNGSMVSGSSNGTVCGASHTVSLHC